jgi:hypothetical protein
MCTILLVCSDFIALRTFTSIIEKAADQDFASSLVRTTTASQMNLIRSSHPIDLTSEPCLQFTRSLRRLGIWPMHDLRNECPKSR